MHEHLGAKHGAESKHKQSMKDRTHEMEAMKAKMAEKDGHHHKKKK